MFEFLPLVTLNVQYFMWSLETQTFADLNVLFCLTISSQRLRRFHSGGTLYTVYLLWVCVGSQGETDNKNRRNSLILKSRSSCEIPRPTIILPCMNGMKTVSPGWWYKRKAAFLQAQEETGKRPTVRLHDRQALSVSTKISDSGLLTHVGC